MKFETIGNNKKKVKITIGIVCVIAIIGISAFTLTRASYKQTQSVPLIKGNISYNKSDLEIVAIKLQQDDGSYKDSDTIPTSGYILNTDISKSYCKVGDDKASKVNYVYKDNTWHIGVTEKGSKCYLTFDKGNPPSVNLATALILSNGGEAAIKAKGNPDFSKTATTDEGMYAMKDDDGTSYYFRGTPTNNYVKFGKHASNYSDSTKAGKDMYWRIIRINGDGTIRLIYDGSEYHSNGESTTDSIAVANTIFNSSIGYATYVGYTHGPAKRDSAVDSGVKMVLDGWYRDSGLVNYSNYLADSGFCGDRTSTTTKGGIPNNTGGTGTTTTYYGAYYRLVTKKEPTLKCATINYGSEYETGSKSDIYTLKGNTKGNESLTYPIALISADEIALAGGIAKNEDFYLYRGYSYFTISPSFSLPIDTAVFSYYGYFDTTQSVNSSASIRPVINIDPSKINNVSIDSNGVYVIS